MPGQSPMPPELSRIGHMTVMGDGPGRYQVNGRTTAELEDPLEELAAGCDVVVSTGGVLAGDSDWIRPLLAERGAVDFW